MIEFLNEKIKDLRLNADLTQDELAKKLGIAKNTLCQYEKNKSNPSLEVIIQVSKIFDVSVDYLLGLENDFGVKTQNTKNSYTQKEQQLIENYRSLTPDLQLMIDETMNTFLRSNINTEAKRKKA